MSPTPKQLPWLTEKDNPGVKYLALRDLADLKERDPKLVAARKEAYTLGPIASVLKHMNKEGYWKKPGPGYGPKYRSTVWSLILLSQLGASCKHDKRIETACKYYLDNAFSKEESLSYNGAPSGTISCLQGNMCAALMALECDDPRLKQTYKWMARNVIGKDVKYYAYSCGPRFECGANGKKSCAWGAVKVMLALGKLHKSKRSKDIKKAIDVGVDFLLGTDPVKARYPTRGNTKPNRSWWKFGFPVYYITDILQIVEALGSLGYGKDPRLKNTIKYIRDQQDEDCHWSLEYEYKGKTWGTYGTKHKPNKWVTYRALKALKDV